MKNNGIASNEEKARYNAAVASVDKANEAREITMFGTTTAIIDRDFDRGGIGKGMYIMGILSDVQEAMAREQYEYARQWANKAKYLMAKVLPRDEQGRML